MSESLRLFLVEDDDDIALLMRKSLQRASHQVTGCRTAADALIVLGHTSFNLVLLDQRLPDMSGLDLLQTLAREGITTPVLMVTGYGDEQLATQVLRAGALDYIVKDPALTFLAELPKRVSESVTRHRLQDLNRLLIEALESARDGVIITDLQGTLLHVNGAVERMTGYTRAQLLGQTPRVFKSSLHPPDFYADMWRTILARTSWQGEVINRRQDGTLLDASLVISPILDGRGQMTHFVGIYRDISERKQLERQLLQAQKMQSVGTLAGGVAHEFNNLLAGIQGYAALGLREAGLTPALREFLEYIVQLSDRAANLTRQLLAFARKPALSRHPLRMDRLVQGTAELVRHTLHVDVAVELPAAKEAEPLSALADGNQLQQVLVNLALNARDALAVREKAGAAGSPPQPIIFRLRHAFLEGDLPAFPQSVPAGDYVVVDVEDGGGGMPPEVLSQALDPFFTTKEVGQGTGLGLPVAFGIVTGHQGFLTIDTMIRQGTCVSLYLPRLTGDDAGPGKEAFEAGQVLEPEQVPGRNILVIDDEEAVLDVVRRFLEIAGHGVTCATTGAQALQLLEQDLPADLVILDLMIPREEGAQTFQRLQQRRPGLPVLLCTGLVPPDLHPSPLPEGAAGLLRKPFRMNELWYAVNQALSPSP
jgi:PAS domain S-box-containing protein